MLGRCLVTVINDLEAVIKVSLEDALEVPTMDGERMGDACLQKCATTSSPPMTCAMSSVSFRFEYVMTRDPDTICQAALATWFDRRADRLRWSPDALEGGGGREDWSLQRRPVGVLGRGRP
jgi:hypothetical protein